MKYMQCVFLRQNTCNCMHLHAPSWQSYHNINISNSNRQATISTEAREMADIHLRVHETTPQSDGQLVMG